MLRCTINVLLRGCERVNKGYSTLTHKVFTTIAYAMQTVTTQCHVETLFQVLCGEKPLQLGIDILPKHQYWKNTEQNTEMKNGKPASTGAIGGCGITTSVCNTVCINHTV